MLFSKAVKTMSSDVFCLPSDDENLESLLDGSAQHGHEIFWFDWWKTVLVQNSQNLNQKMA